ncbi:MAG: sigma-70 family RNA polymerase sigma factor, partial [Peptococcaceae bacterium]|nr:sigma-70 family RNA polymerase sigma factor [Peptococcaceae bacterium]
DVMGTEDDNIYQQLEKDVDYSLLRIAMGRLSQRERVIVEMRFGLSGRKERTQKEVADLLGISQSYISRLEKKIIGRLQREFQKLE